MIAYLMKRCGFEYEQALIYVKQRREKVMPNVGFQKQLRAFEQVKIPERVQLEEDKDEESGEGKTEQNL